MQNDKIYSEIINSFVRTKIEANMLLSELDLLRRSLFKIGEGDFNSTLEKNVRAKVANAITQIANDVNREQILKILSEKIKSLNYLSLTIAFEPNLETEGRIITWIRQNLGEGIAIDIKTDKSTLGGAVIEYKGKIGNFTILPKIDEYFLKNNVNF